MNKRQKIAKIILWMSDIVNDPLWRDDSVRMVSNPCGFAPFLKGIYRSTLVPVHFALFPIVMTGSGDRYSQVDKIGRLVDIEELPRLSPDGRSRIMTGCKFRWFHAIFV